ncbi:MAG: hypothetical protein DM484_23180 [Candidatus Methylumidiphilus alinenensis]|uniref:Uncharacterized protein n=1 Tax=Candidatus Methylumidiphilus alinenensis TaxID=2202197 RepID=A0A2W4QMT3_9GAMM|nr:MAG: hypothetical protein DM484_23180 [Candidatus Methylumidiphilus alinenensis]
MSQQLRKIQAAQYEDEHDPYRNLLLSLVKKPHAQTAELHRIVGKWHLLQLLQNAKTPLFDIVG